MSMPIHRLEKGLLYVGPKLLLTTLENNSIRGHSMDLFRSYLSRGTQEVRIGNDFSVIKIIDCEVPQGTVLGPVCLIFIATIYSD